MKLLRGQRGLAGLLGIVVQLIPFIITLTQHPLVLMLSVELKQLFWPYPLWPKLFVAVSPWIWSHTVLTFIMYLQFKVPNLHDRRNYLFWPPASSNHSPFPSSFFPPPVLSCLGSHPQFSSPGIIPEVDGATQTVVMASTTKQHSMTSEVEPT